MHFINNSAHGIVGVGVLAKTYGIILAGLWGGTIRVSEDALDGVFHAVIVVRKLLLAFIGGLDRVANTLHAAGEGVCFFRQTFTSRFVGSDSGDEGRLRSRGRCGLRAGGRAGVVSSCTLAGDCCCDAWGEGCECSG